MEDKIQFGKFIAQKRKDANMTQKELAEQLYVSDTTVSKWERGLSYPDISLITDICKVLNISEHEFFTACDDLNARREKSQAKIFRVFTKTTFISLCIMYALAIVICFICNLAIDHKLSWFFIVLASVALAFSITCLPAMLKKNRVILTFIAASVLTYVLEFVCCVFVSGDWLWSIAYPITAISLAWIAVIILILRFLKLDVYIKAGLTIIVMSIISVTINRTVGYFIGEEMPGALDYMDFTSWGMNNIDLMVDGIVFYSLFIIGMIGVIYGIMRKSLHNRS